MSKVIDHNTLTEKDEYDNIDITYAFGLLRESMSFETKIIFDTWYKNGLLTDEDVEDNNTLITKSNLITEYPSYNITINKTCVGFKKGKAFKIPLDELFSKWENCVLSNEILCYDIVEVPKNQRFRCHKSNDKSYRENITKEEYLSVENQKLNNCKLNYFLFMLRRIF